jgi:heme/copper-type cytochrome/quinol oxidase subunit 3
LCSGGVLASLAIGLAGWAREFFTRGIEEGLGSVAVAVFIVSEVMIFGTMFAAFWMGRIDNADQWASYIPTDLDRTFAIWLTLILWASSITIVLSQRAFERDNRGSAQFWLVATFALGLLSAQFWLVATFALGLLFVVLHMRRAAHDGVESPGRGWLSTGHQHLCDDFLFADRRSYLARARGAP